MKREFLQNFKVGDQALPKEVVDAIMDENGKDIETAKKPFADYETIKQQLMDANKTIDNFKSMDVDAIKKAADEWKTKAEQAEQDAAAKIAEMEFSGRIKEAITGARGKNAKAVMALLDLDALKASKNQEADIKAALETLKKDSGYLFESEETPPPYAGGTGTQKLLAGSDAALRAAMGLPEPETK